jgi:hypothetical protein
MKKKQLMSMGIVLLFVVGVLPHEVCTGGLRLNGKLLTECFHLSENKLVKRNFTYHFSPPEFINDTGYVKPTVRGANAVFFSAGKPLLPTHKRTISLPFGTKITDISCDIGTVHTISLSRKLLPAPEPVICGNESNPPCPVMEEYASDTIFPTEWCTAAVGGGLNHHNEHHTFVSFHVFPVRYAAADDEIFYSEDITITLTYQESHEPLLSARETFDMVIIAPEVFSSSLQPLVTHKNDVGIKTFLKTTEEIYQGYDGIDKPEKIKYFLKNAIETWGITYALLVGGLKSVVYGVPRDDANQGSQDWHLPVRYTNLEDPGSFSDPGFISDLYYMDIYDGEGHFSSWDSNGNGIFAEWKHHGGEKDVIDFYPDVYVGRLACRNTFEVTTVVDKIITYETTPIDASWYNRMVLVGGDGFDDSRYGTHWPEDELVCEKIFSYMEHFDPVRLYASNRENDSEHTPLTANIIRELNDGCGYIIFAGHGCPYKWVTNWPDEFDEPIEGGGISIFNFPQIRNGDKLPICCIEGGCHNSLFNVSLLTTLFDRDNSRHLMTYGVPTPECLGWSFVRKRNGGAVANFGYPSCTFISPGEKGDLDGDGVNEPDIFEAWRPYMVQQYYKIIGSGAEFLGDAAGGAVRNYLNAFPGMAEQLDAKVIEQVIFFGDPSLKIGGYP